MGVIQHHAVVATTWNRGEVDRIRKWIDAIPPRSAMFGDAGRRRLFIFGEGISNEYYTVVMIPDGSKEGWPESDSCNELREEFIRELERNKESDGSTAWHWVEVGFGELGRQLHGNQD